MYRIIWNDGSTESTHEFDTKAQLQDWVWSQVGAEYLNYAFKIEQQIDGEWTDPTEIVGLRDS
jgi:hypothetical protein